MMQDSITIMVVDDDPAVLSATARIVKNAGYPVIKASSALECETLLKKQKPDILLLDVVLPDMEGPYLSKKIKSDPDHKDTHIILLSGMKTSSDHKSEGLDDGADEYMARPVSNRELVARINAAARIVAAEKERDRVILELKDALAKIKKLSGLLPICSYCKSIRDDKGYWNQIESYIKKHSEADFSHSICRACAEEHYPGLEIYDE
jgi:CheY-like chemotaxis protein